MAPYNPPAAHYAHIMLPFDIDNMCMKYIMGKNGTNLYDWTKRYNLQYVWLNNTSKKLELWGSECSFENGAKENIENKIKNRIQSYNAKKNKSLTYFCEERESNYHVLMKKYEKEINSALPNDSEDVTNCYMKDFYDETILSEEWNILSDNEKRETLDKDIIDYMNEYIEQISDKFQAV
jgi:hypothetical protein